MAHAPATIASRPAPRGVIDVLGVHLEVIQVHGFADRKLGARAIVSVGEKKPEQSDRGEGREAVEEVTGPHVLKYPGDTKELGATTNVQGAIIRRAGGSSLHIEMDGGLRRDLVKDGALRGDARRAVGVPSPDRDHATGIGWSLLSRSAPCTPLRIGLGEFVWTAERTRPRSLS